MKFKTVAYSLFIVSLMLSCRGEEVTPKSASDIDLNLLTAYRWETVMERRAGFLDKVVSFHDTVSYWFIGATCIYTSKSITADYYETDSDVSYKYTTEEYSYELNANDYILSTIHTTPVTYSVARRYPNDDEQEDQENEVPKYIIKRNHYKILALNKNGLVMCPVSLYPDVSIIGSERVYYPCAL